jgi:hypothetical protein
MNGANQLEKIGLLLAKDRFIPILKEMTIAVVFSVKVYGISRSQTAHDGGNRNGSGSQQKMNMVCKKSPCIAHGLGSGEDISKAG